MTRTLHGCPSLFSIQNMAEKLGLEKLFVIVIIDSSMN